ncbi:hypothetical protein H2201_005460 [Coniosporium apollinis]|uniref:HTH La-type RNA-binding domain-containing protein n=1 Tax=Coniosporium apollinis TaxID=61459 RepID=A0ABQ9NUT8_9PEZI|nr:hypothetical protein H2201_005460 [Coniosporium apollinis]
MAATFSYAQAAKGMSSSVQSSNAPSGTATPSKDTTSASTDIPTEPSGANWADLDDASTSAPVKEPEEVSTAPAVQGGESVISPEKQASTAERRKSFSGLSSPEFGTASSSTLGKEDDVSSVPNASSESTWENKSQTSNVVEQSAENGDEKLEKVESKKAKQERNLFTMLQEAPPPAVNIWKQRAEARAAQQPSRAKSSAPSGPAATALPLKPADEKPAEAGRSVPRRKSRSGPASYERTDLSSNGFNIRDCNDEKESPSRRETRSDNISTRRPGNDQASRPFERGPKDNVSSLPPPVQNKASWPTPDNAQDEDKKKSMEKGDKKGRERGSSTSSKPHGKNEWVQLAYTPNVIFNTPIPNTSSRRGGRGGSRGGRDAGGRGASSAVNGASSPEKENSAVSHSSGDQQRRTRSEIISTDVPNAKRTASPESTLAKDRGSPTAEGENGTKPVNTDGPEAPAPAQRRAAYNEPSPNQLVSRTNSLPLQSSTSRPRQARNERRQDGESVPPGAEESSEAKGSAIKDGQPQQPKTSTFERRSGPFGSLSSRERGEHRPRGGMRNGRGGNAYQHASASGNHFSNARASSMNSSATFPHSPTSFHPEQQNTFFSQSSHSSRGYRNAGPRSQSIPTEAYYGRASAGYPTGPQAMAPLQTYMPGMYDYSVMQPLSAVPYSPYVDQYSVLGMVSVQLEYYFSLNNLCKDMYLRKHMDSQGFVFLTVIAAFNRMKHLTTDLELIKYACYQSRDIEFRVGPDGKERIRRREGWEQWVLNMEDRDPSARNNGPEDLHYPPVPHPAGFDSQYMVQHQTSHPASPSSPNFVPNGTLYQSLNGVTSPVSQSNGGTGQLSNGVPPAEPAVAGRRSSTTSGPAFHPCSPSDLQTETDSFPNEQIEGLTVIVRPATEKAPPFHSASSRTFSNGSLDGRSIADELSKFDTRRNSSQINGSPTSLGDEAANASEPNRSPSPGYLSNAIRSNTSSPSTGLQMFWVKDSDRPVNARPENTDNELYSEIREKALVQRSAAIGKCPYDMDVLYQFWAHFLIRNFNTSMYDEFRSLAFEDFQNGSVVGMNNLVRYYGHALTSEIVIRERIARHYVDLVKWENPDQEKPAFKQLRSAWRNGALNMKNRKRISGYVDADLRAALEQ